MNTPKPPLRPDDIRHRITGTRFTFTLEEESRLYRFTTRIQGNLQRKPAGWRVCIVQDVTDMHVVIQGALDRSDKPEPDSARIGRPLG